jgi:hypothetical protein
MVSDLMAASESHQHDKIEVLTPTILWLNSGWLCKSIHQRRRSGMDNSSKKKSALLGMPYGTASNRLRKMLIFRMAQKLGEDVCYRCENKIKTIEDLSIEHKHSWELSENPVKGFFDLDDVTFSHLNCNVGAAYHKPPSHGHKSTYEHAGCRCDACKAAKAVDNKKYRKT